MGASDYTFLARCLPVFGWLRAVQAGWMADAKTESQFDDSRAALTRSSSF